MVKFCTNCGAAMQEGTTFCTACGARLDGAAEPSAASAPYQDIPKAAPDAAAASSPYPESGQQTGEGQPGGAPYPPPGPEQAPTPYPIKGAKGESKPVTTIGFMLLQLLYAIPIVGFFSSLVLAIAPERKDLKRHALANFLWKVILLLLFLFGAVRFFQKAQVVWSDFDPYMFSEGNLPESLQDLLDSMGVEIDGPNGQ